MNNELSTDEWVFARIGSPFGQDPDNPEASSEGCFCLQIVSFGPNAT
jgi:hypothetical protein